MFPALTVAIGTGGEVGAGVEGLTGGCPWCPFSKELLGACPGYPFCFPSGPGSGTGGDKGAAEADREAGGAVVDGEWGLFGDDEGGWRGSPSFF